MATKKWLLENLLKVICFKITNNIDDNFKKLWVKCLKNKEQYKKVKKTLFIFEILEIRFPIRKYLKLILNFEIKNILLEYLIFLEPYFSINCF